MRRRSDLTIPERAAIISEVAIATTTLEISNIIGRCHGTVKKLVAASDGFRTRADAHEGLLFKSDTRYEPYLASSEKLPRIPVSLAIKFSDVGENTVSKGTRCRILKIVA